MNDDLKSALGTKPGATGVAASERTWLNRTVVGAGLTSALGDLSYETSNAILPGFLAVLGIPAAALGSIEGAADALSSFTKLGSGYLADRLGHRKALVVAGYALTTLMQVFLALAVGWPLILIGRLVGWFGRGVRGPFGSFADRLGHRRVLAGGYALGAVTAALTAYAFAQRIDSIGFLASIFACAGVYIAAEDALESSLTAEYVGPDVRGTAYGVLGSVNGVGDFVSSTAVGVLWTTVSPVMAFSVAALLMLAGTVAMRRSG